MAKMTGTGTVMESRVADPAPIDSDAELMVTESLAAGVVRQIYRVPELARSAEPGQFVQLEVQPEGSFPMTRRPLTVSDVDTSAGTFTVVFEEVGAGTCLLGSAERGAVRRVLGPLGQGYDIGSGGWLLIGGGMGAAGFPLLSRRAEVRRTLLGARDADHLLDVGCVRASCVTEDGSRGACGLITALCEGVDWGDYENVALCGPLAMMEAVIRLVPEGAMDRVQVSTESRMACGYGVCEGCAIPGRDGYLKCCTDGPVVRADRIDWEAWRGLVT